MTICLLAAGLPLPQARAADFLEPYKQGLEAADARQWPQAADWMRQAIAAQPEARVRVKKGFFFRRYLPHFHLGKALFESGDCVGALRAWSESEAQGVVNRFPEYAQLQEGRAACSQIAVLQDELEAALERVRRAQSAASASRQQLAALSRPDTTSRALRDEQSAAESGLARIQARLSGGDVTLAEVEMAAAEAEQARELFLTLERRARQHRTTQLRRIEGEMRAEVEPLIEAAERELEASEFLRPYPSEVARRRQAVEQALEHAEALDSGLSRGEIEALRLELESSTRELRAALTAPPPELTQAVESFLAGDYAGVLIDLSDVAFASNMAVAHAHLLRAAALLSLYYVGGESDPTLLEGARTEVLACRRADPNRTPPQALFSPRFVSFFAEQVAGEKPGP